MGSQQLHELLLSANIYAAGLLTTVVPKLLRNLSRQPNQLTDASPTDLRALEKRMTEKIAEVKDSFDRRLDSLKEDMLKDLARQEKDILREKGARHAYQQRLEDTRQEFGTAIARIGAITDVVAANSVASVSGEHPALPPASNRTPSGKHKTRP
jgi:tRNA(Met) C34 N-acetyltransferase TmcA